MPKAELSKKTNTKIEDKTSLKGTLASVFLLLAFIIVTWLGVYGLYLDRL